MKIRFPEEYTEVTINDLKVGETFQIDSDSDLVYILSEYKEDHIRPLEKYGMRMCVCLNNGCVDLINKTRAIIPVEAEVMVK